MGQDEFSYESEKGGDEIFQDEIFQEQKLRYEVVETRMVCKYSIHGEASVLDVLPFLILI